MTNSTRMTAWYELWFQQGKSGNKIIKEWHEYADQHHVKYGSNLPMDEFGSNAWGILKVWEMFSLRKNILMEVKRPLKPGDVIKYCDTTSFSRPISFYIFDKKNWIPTWSHYPLIVLSPRKFPVALVTLPTPKDTSYNEEDDYNF